MRKKRKKLINFAVECSNAAYKHMETTAKYPVGIQTFSNIREEGYTYVDKTALVYKLVSKGKFFFLSRPRRFGKSLMLTTIQAYFEGRKDLFKGLAMERLEKDWEEYPVILLSLATYDPNVERSLESILENHLHEMETKYDCQCNPAYTFSTRFGNIIKAAYEKTGRQVVVLIDEYDAPLVANLEKPKEHDRLKGILKSVYTNLKDMDRYIRFGMLTGITRFSKMNIFSGLNNLNDISMVNAFSTICGITEEELRRDLTYGVDQLAAELGTDHEGALAALKENYDGYHFTGRCPDLYNPFSLLLAITNLEIKPYWFRIGSPTFLAPRLRKEKVRLADILTEAVGENSIDDIDSYRTSPLSLLFQTGYLTIKDYDQRRGRYWLGIPNKEVEKGLFLELLSYNTEMSKNDVDLKMWDIRDAFEAGDPDTGLSIIKSLFASIPPIVTQNMPELFYENNLYMLFRLVGIDARAEWWTADGRIDMLLSMPEYIYVMELKLGSTAEAALEQIESKDYTLQWKHDGRKVFKIGINYSKETRNIERWVIGK